MSQQPGKRKGKSRVEQEVAQAYADDAVEALQSVIRQRKIEQVYDMMARWTPIALHAELRRFLQAEYRDLSDEDQLEIDIPSNDSAELSLLNVVMSNVWNEHAPYKDQCNWARNTISDRSVIWPVIRHVLENPTSCEGWLHTAWLSIADYSPDPVEAARLLVPYLRPDSTLSRALNELCPNAQSILDQRLMTQDHSFETATAWCLANVVRNASGFVALALSKIAPTTPGLAEVLIDSMSRDWFVSCYLEEEEIHGPGAAAEALVRLGTMGQQALPNLRKAVLGGRRQPQSEMDRWMASKAFIVLCQDDAAVQALIEEPKLKKSLKRWKIRTMIGVRSLRQRLTTDSPH